MTTSFEQSQHRKALAALKALRYTLGSTLNIIEESQVEGEDFNLKQTVSEPILRNLHKQTLHIKEYLDMLKDFQPIHFPNTLVATKLIVAGQISDWVAGDRQWISPKAKNACNFYILYEDDKGDVYKLISTHFNDYETAKTLALDIAEHNELSIETYTPPTY